MIDTSDSPVHEVSAPGTAWTTHNAAEALPGVLTPLGYTFWLPACERGLRAAFFDFGVLARAEVVLPAAVDHRFSATFYGRYCANVDSLRAIAERTPGTSGAAFERQFFGESRDLSPVPPHRTRLPFVLAKMPRAALAVTGRVKREVPVIHAWWRTATAEAESVADDVTRARVLLAAAQGRLEETLRLHMATTMLTQGILDRLTGLARAAGRPGRELDLGTGLGGMEETGLVIALWELGRGQLDLASFLADYGFHGPGEGEVTSRSWREDPGPVLELAAKYAGLPDDRHPLTVEQRQRAIREAAEGEVLAGLAAWQRPGGRLLLGAARRFVPLRETMKWAFLRGIDAGRAATRAAGRSLQHSGVLDDADDVAFLTFDEIMRGPGADARRAVRARRDQHAAFESVALPTVWVGSPEPLRRPDGSDGPDRSDGPVGAGASDGAPLRGVAAASGVAEGRVRVIMTAAEAVELEPGEVLVCPTTDPSWVSAFYLAAALVVDIGGPVSHAAIVSRELGVPCVVGTGHGTAQLRTGDLVRVDGAAGTVELLEAARPRAEDPR